MPKGPISPKIREIARQLDVPLVGGNDPMPRLVEACVRKVEEWVKVLGPAETFDELLEIVAAKLKVHFEVIRSVGDLSRVMREYLHAGETGFVDLRKELDGSADAVVIRLLKAPTWSDRQYVAVIDARGKKEMKEWFSKWHELAHLIAEPQTSIAFRRTLTTRRDPVERLMDQIAGELAFYRGLLRPALEAHELDLSDPRLRALAEFREDALPFASLHASMIALLKQSPVPTVLVEAILQLKKSERDDATAEPKLRAVTTAHNAAAIRHKLFVHQWIRVPKRSVIYRLHAGEPGCEHVLTPENLSWWESDGEALPNRKVIVEAMSAGSGRILALIKKA